METEFGVQAVLACIASQAPTSAATRGYRNNASQVLSKTCLGVSERSTAQAIAHGGPQLQILAPNNIDLPLKVVLNSRGVQPVRSAPLAPYISFQEFQNCSEVGHLSCMRVELCS